LNFTNSTNNVLPSGTNLALGTASSTVGPSLSLTGKASVASVQTVASTTLTGRSAISLTAGATGGTMTLNLNAITRNPGAVVSFTLGAGTTLTTTSTSTTNGIMGAW